MPAIFNLTSWLSSTGGGIPPVIQSYSGEFCRRGLDCTVAGLKDPYRTPLVFPPHIRVLTGSIAGPRAFGYSPELARLLRDRVQSDSVVHVHGLWMYPGLLARRLADASGAVRIVSPHGMLEPWALQNSNWKKRLAGWCFEWHNLETASCLHALCAAEARNFKKHGLKKPVAVIPNGVDPDIFRNLPGRAELEKQFPALSDRRWMLFLSRLHPKKGLPHLLKAWSRLAVRFPKWLLVIAGPEEMNHEAEMKQLTAGLGLQNSVCFTGPLHGRNKLAALGGAEMFLLPSFSEGFSMAILEAAAAGLPVLLTPQCNFPELSGSGGGIEAAPDAASCEAGLLQLLSMSSDELQQMGNRGRILIHRFYTWSQISQQMLDVYHWLAGDKSKPECVQVKT